MKDIPQSIKAHLYDRAVSPLSGTFIVSWLLWNYQFVFVLFSSMKVKEKFAIIEYELYPSVWDFINLGLGAPLLTTLIIVFIYPYPNKFVYEFSRSHQKYLNEIKQKIEDDTPLTKKKWREIRKEMLNIRVEHEVEIEKYKADCDTARSMLEESESKSSSYKEKILHLEDNETQLIKDIANLKKQLDKQLDELGEKALNIKTAEYIKSKLRSDKEKQKKQKKEIERIKKLLFKPKQPPFYEKENNSRSIEINKELTHRERQISLANEMIEHASVIRQELEELLYSKSPLTEADQSRFNSLMLETEELEKRRDNLINALKRSK